MKIKWLGHSSFLITTDAGTRVVTDPYTTGRGLNYAQIEEAADIVTVSHGHGDHNNVSSIRGNPQMVNGVGSSEVKGIRIRGVASYHDNAGGTQRGPNVVFCFEVDGVRVCHLGDLGHMLDKDTIAEIGRVDVLLVPVGGLFTIGPQEATAVIGSLSPKVVIPMHYKNDKCAMPIGNVDEFIKGKPQVTLVGASELELASNRLVGAQRIMVLTPAL